MGQPAVGHLLRQLRLRAPGDAWAAFLRRYSPLLLEVVHLFERDEDRVGDCYVFICEQLSRRGFARLLRFRPDGPARFSTWLYAVARNLCIDWHRREMGRYRVFASVARMPALDQRIFQCLFVDGLTTEQAFLELGPAFPDLTLAHVVAAATRLERTLKPGQRWLLAVRRAQAVTPEAVPVADAAQVPLATSMPEADPEARLVDAEERAILAAALGKLAARDRLIVRLRFEYGLTLDEMARLLHLENAQSADRRVREVLDRLRNHLRPAAAALRALRSEPER
ncbi:MAG: RNA polymerase sigma factor [Vicinamibacterales bacterium]